eukprot:28224-Chlamydomonas_euryale.AAC.8
MEHGQRGLFVWSNFTCKDFSACHRAADVAAKMRWLHLSHTPLVACICSMVRIQSQTGLFHMCPYPHIKHTLDTVCGVKYMREGKERARAPELPQSWASRRGPKRQG